MQTLNTCSRNINCNHLNFCKQVTYEKKVYYLTVHRINDIRGKNGIVKLLCTSTFGLINLATKVAIITCIGDDGC